MATPIALKTDRCLETFTDESPEGLSRLQSDINGATTVADEVKSSRQETEKLRKNCESLEIKALHLPTARYLDLTIALMKLDVELAQKYAACADTAATLADAREQLLRMQTDGMCPTDPKSYAARADANQAASNRAECESRLRHVQQQRAKLAQRTIVSTPNNPHAGALSVPRAQNASRSTQ